MTDKPMHCSDEQLLLYTDDELPSRSAAHVRNHLADCPECRTRMTTIKATIADSTQTYRRSSEPAMDASGPRALLKARLAESAHNSNRSGWMHPRLARGLAYLCALALLTVTGVKVSHQIASTRLSAYSRMLPDPGFTPGSTREVALADLCSTDHDEVVRSVPSPLQQKVFQEYGIRGNPVTEFEVDYLITPGLGGSDDVRNLWPEPHSNTEWNSYVKDQLEDRLHRMVCERKISLNEAQRDIASNWIVAYQKYFHTQQPLTNPALSNTSEVSRVSNAQHLLLLPFHGF